MYGQIPAVLRLDGPRRVILASTFVLAISAVAGWKSSPWILALAVLSAALLVIVWRADAAPALAVPAIMLIPFDMLVSSYVRVNIAVIIIPILLAVWILMMIRRGRISVLSSPANLPVLLFILFTAASLLFSRVDWDVRVPSPPNFMWIQLGQSGIYILSMFAFLVTANLSSRRTVHWIMYTYVVVGGILAFLWAVPPLIATAEKLTPPGLATSVYWVWLTAFAASFILFGARLPLWFRVFCAVSLVALWLISLSTLRDWLSGQLPPAAALLLLFALKMRRNAPLLLLLVVLVLVMLGGIIYEFWGGDAELQNSGVGRLAHYQLIWRFASQKPWLGLGPGAYRLYVNTDTASITQLLYRGAPVSAHNNYLDLFANVGVLGLGSVIWLLITIGGIGWRLRARLPTSGPDAVYANAALAGLGGTIVSGLLGDWFLPFVYNVGFPGFRSSVLVWLFFGGLVALSRLTGPGTALSSAAASMTNAKDTWRSTADDGE